MNHFLITLLFCFSLFFSVSAQGDRGAGITNTNINSTTKTTIPTVHALVIGISDYENAKKLEYADDDAILVYNALVQTFPASKDNITKLINKEASEFAMKSAIQQLYEKAKEGDLVIFYFAGHGDVAKKFGQESGYFLAYNASGSREYTAGGALDFAFVIDGINGIASEKKAKVWLMTDACRAGKIIDENGAKSTLTSLNQGFLNTTKFISCQAHELSYEFSNISHGAFTYYLVKGFSGAADAGDKNGAISIKELNDYLEVEVRNATSDAQTPTITTSNKFEDVLPANPGLLSLITDPKNKEDLASRGRGNDDGAAKSKTLIQFENAIISENYYGNPGSAKAIYDQAKSSKTATNAELATMHDILIERLLDNSQNYTNLFLSGKPEIQKNLDVEKAYKDLTVVLDMLDKKSLFYNQVANRCLFFKSLLVIQKEQVQQYEQAEKDLKDLILKEPNAAYFHQGLAMLYIQKSNNDAAQKELAAVSDLISTWDKPKNTSAYVFLLAGKLDQAEILLNETEKISSNASDVMLLKTKLFKANYELKKAEDLLLKNIKNDSTIDLSEYRSIQAEIDQLRGRVSNAEQTLITTLEKDKSNVTLLLQLGNLYQTEKDTAKALNCYRKVANLEPGNKAAEFGIKFLTNQPIEIKTEDINYYSEADVLFNVGKLESQGKFTEAITVLQKAIEIASWNPDLYYRLGKIYYTIGKKAESENALKNALKASPYHFESVKSLTNLYLTQKKNAEAENVIRTYEPYFTESSKWYSFKYETYNWIGNKKELVTILEQAIKLDSLDTDPYRGLYQFHIKNADFTNATREFNQVIKLGGRGRDSLDFLIRVKDQVNLLLSQGNFVPTEEGLQVLLKFDPYDLESMIILAKILYMKKDYKAAMRQLNEYQNYVLNMSTASQIQFYDLRGKVLLELEYYREAEESFRLTGSKSEHPNYIGSAMAQYMQGKEVWKRNFTMDPSALPPYFNEDQFLLEYNTDALKRMKAMQKKAGSSKQTYGGGEQMNRY